MSKLNENIADIDACQTIDELKAVFQKIIENYGFSSYGFSDVTQPGRIGHLYVGTHSDSWNETYVKENFVEADPCLALARRTNRLFSWGQICLPKHDGVNKPKAVKTMETAKDFGVKNGITIPFHYSDNLGRTYHSVCAIFWKNKAQQFKRFLKSERAELHLILLYWAQKLADIEAVQNKFKSRFYDEEGQPLIASHLTDREAEVIRWAGRGKTSGETADILKISVETVETHIRRAMKKLGASSKTHAAVKAIYLDHLDI